MAEHNSGWVSGGVVSAEDARLATGVLAQSGAGPIQSQTGVKPALGFPGQVSATPTPSRSVTVNAFQAVIQGTRTTNAGAYLVTLDQTKTVTVPPSHASNPRVDLIVASQSDHDYDDPDTAFVVDCVSGTPAAAPVDPVVPGDYLVLARIQVPAGSAVVNPSDITDLRTHATAVGGVRPLLPNESLPTTAFAGQRIYDLETHLDLVRKDGTWLPAVAGSIQAFGPADPGWPKNVTGSTTIVINQVTVPAAPFPRLLHVTARVSFTATVADDRYDFHIAVGGTVERLTAVTPGPTKITSALVVGQRLQPAGTTPLVLQATMKRVAGTGAVSAINTGIAYTSIDVLAVPV